MTKLNFKIVLTLFAVIFFTACEQTEELSTSTEIQSEQTATYEYQVIPGKYIVVFNEDANGRFAPSSFAEGQEIMAATAESFLKEKASQFALERVYSGGIQGFVAEISDFDVESIINDPRVKSVEPDYQIIMKAPPWAGGGGGSSTGEEIPFGITRVNGGITYTGNNVAWVIDSGVDLDHEDLNVDASRAFNAFTSGRDAKSADDLNGHGSHVAGTIAAIDNETGVVGVAAGATVVPVKVLDARGSGSYSGVIAGVDYVAANGSAGDVANMSLGGPVSPALDDAVKAAAANGINMCLAAGNESTDSNGSSPARVNGNNIYTISAMDINDQWASFSNYANPPVDYCAPGVSIKSTWKDGGYNTISGTSMATPHVAGILLLGNISTDGTVIGDPDGNSDPIAVH
ncbi:S8 family peptidase [Mangrovivirga sp. M17]|uniref:S8 family peptidase n=1 Tax=Mangrovivirga halotolerans TaxID=2993936 RepID=A0ABT3RMD9_9BACT|nr:S8 family peptidase [Mangrovivirga halotolerans]MCX2742447.1 S8 family peptidase [Mangrovivirga halotolerans]